MRAMQLDRPGEPLRLVQRQVPVAGPADIPIEVTAYSVCRTDLHVVDGDIQGKLPIVPGHEIVGKVIVVGANADRFDVGDRVGVPWLGSTCHHCRFCKMGMENLCDDAQFTGFTKDGGFATHAVARADYCFALPPTVDGPRAAPPLCAGLIGYRAFSMMGEARTFGLYGFGASAHIIAQLAARMGRKVVAFTKPGDVQGQKFARLPGCIWAGGSDETPPVELDAAIVFAPVGALVPVALAAIRKSGTVVCAGIHMSDIPCFPYALLWGEREVRSVANLTRADGDGFFAAIREVEVRTQVKCFALDDANEALARLRNGDIVGAAVLLP